MQLRTMAFLLLLAPGLAGGCGSQEGGSSSLGETRRAVKSYLLAKLDAWQGALERVESLAPSDRGWDVQKDAQLLLQMRAQWRAAHAAYQAIEPTVGPLLPDLNHTVDGRYEDQLVPFGFDGDPDPFDDSGVVGLHAIERILYANEIPAATTARESILLGYMPPAFPATPAEAAAFKEKLVGSLVTTVKAMKAQFAPLDVDVGFATKATVDLLSVQANKVLLASGPGNEESRYSHSTLADVRAGVAACRDIWGFLKNAVAGLAHGSDLVVPVEQGFARLQQALDANPGDAVPQVPDTWNFDDTIPEDLKSAYGKLYMTFKQETDPKVPTSLVSALIRTADRLHSVEER